MTFDVLVPDTAMQLPLTYEVQLQTNLHELLVAHGITYKLVPVIASNCYGIRFTDKEHVMFFKLICPIGNYEYDSMHAFIQRELAYQLRQEIDREILESIGRNI